MKVRPLRQKGYQLLHDGAVALAQVEANGIGIDVGRLARTKEELTRRIVQLRQDVQKSRVWKLWRKRYGDRANMLSREQLGVMLHEELGFKVGRITESGRPSTDEDALSRIDHPFVASLLKLLHCEKTLGTFVKGIESEVVNGRLHPFFNLHTVRTYRSSSDSPNFQNFPVRDKEVSQIIRSLFVPSRGCVLVENDFKGIEVSVSACYHKDKNFISYITTPGKDMHRDMAAQIYKLRAEDVSKDARYGAKNKFVFPQFYGDYYVSCAKALWEWIEKGKLTGPSGVPLREHLRANGVKKLGACDPSQRSMPGTFERHVQEVERDFWDRRFREYGRWRKRWWEDYQQRGWFDLLTGFRISGVFRRNQVTNAPIQGSAFHCLLWTLIEVNRQLNVRSMRSKIVGQIHDSLIADVPAGELQEYLSLVEEVATKGLREEWDWLVVPLEIEYEITPLGGSWFDKREIKFRDGRFYRPDGSGKSTTDAERFLRTLTENKQT